MPSFCVPERSPVTTLHQKLNQLSLTCMARQLDQTIAEAASKNRSFADTLESLVDCELQSRDSRSVERALPALPPAHPLLHRQLPLQTSQEPHGAEAAYSAFAGPGVHRQRHQRHFYRQSWRGKNLLSENHRL